MRKNKKMFNEFVEFNSSRESMNLSRLMDMIYKTKQEDDFYPGDCFFYVKGDIPVLLETNIGDYVGWTNDRANFVPDNLSGFGSQIPVDIFEYTADDGERYITSSFNFRPNKSNSLFILYSIIKELKKVPSILITYRKIYRCSHDCDGIRNFIADTQFEHNWRYSIEINGAGRNDVHFNMNEQKKFVNFITQKRFGLNRSFDTVRESCFDIPKVYLPAGWFEDNDNQMFTSYDSVFDITKSLVGILKAEIKNK